MKSKLFKKIVITIAFSLTLFSITLSSQEARPIDIGIEVQAYPTGVIPGLTLEKAVSYKASVFFRVGYQWIRHRDLGKHDDERGSGYGFSLGFKRFGNEDFSGLSFAIRGDVWWNEIDWRTDEGGTGSPEFGTSNITVIQPTILAEYGLKIGEKLLLKPSVAVGFERNVKTDGEDTGEGFIGLIGVTLSKRIQ